jgi:hypothetical protein
MKILPGRMIHRKVMINVESCLGANDTFDPDADLIKPAM